ncbi:MAG: hypothetical protein BWX56_01465 [Euryarchaeota archaeon ADurb.Bin023]|uniref:Uncharacterized protein n=1 Tax=Candidatus Methanofastidiosum methylothiophilum TaxID=1705564 RepID=A0A150JBV9_9EURY|nr:MAG: hypothetical protein AN188_00877 [Candidatus Methanofastidiosum methylthiophilus]OQC49757.1 MAG: hypothetical protein BWX56_01465 [Euryarchaeota archaeon ADurb.Bin023]
MTTESAPSGTGAPVATYEQVFFSTKNLGALPALILSINLIFIGEVSLALKVSSDLTAYPSIWDLG